MHVEKVMVKIVPYASKTTYRDDSLTICDLGMQSSSYGGI